MDKKKTLKKKIDLLNERSNEVQEILGKAPIWVIRYGISAVLVIVLALLVGAALISYNDVIPAQIVITSKNPPVYLKANSTGRLSEVFVTHDQMVEKNEKLAEIENTAAIDDVYYLKNKLEVYTSRISTLDSLQLIFPPYLDLGTIQLAYGDFITHYQNFILYNSLIPNKSESKLILRQLKEQKSLRDKQEQQLILFRQDLELSLSAYERQDQLYKKGVISKAEFEKASREYITDKQQYEGFKTNISNTQIAIANFNKLLTKSGIEGEQFQNDYRQKLEKAYQNLNIELLKWEQTYILKSPIVGKVTIFDIWNKFQNVTIGQTVFTIVPNNLDEIIGRVTLPIQNSGKVKVGQRVIIKLANYPFQEWGSLKGTIANISEVPKQEEDIYYTLYIEMEGLKTSYGKQIEFKQEMRGSAEIVVEELSILQRIFYQLRKTFNRE